MNDNIAKLLEQLSQKLGTTSEYLWMVLCKQAPIDATITLVQVIAIWLFGYILFKTHKRLMRKMDGAGYGAKSLYEKYEGAATVPMFVAAVVFAFLGVASFLCINTIFNGYFNPEYWALDKILTEIKK